MTLGVTEITSEISICFNVNNQINTILNILSPSKEIETHNNTQIQHTQRLLSNTKIHPLIDSQTHGTKEVIIPETQTYALTDSQTHDTEELIIPENSNTCINQFTNTKHKRSKYKTFKKGAFHGNVNYRGKHVFFNYFR